MKAVCDSIHVGNIRIERSIFTCGAIRIGVNVSINAERYIDIDELTLKSVDVPDEIRAKPQIDHTNKGNQIFRFFHKVRTPDLYGDILKIEEELQDKLDKLDIISSYVEFLVSARPLEVIPFAEFWDVLIRHEDTLYYHIDATADIFKNMPHYEFNFTGKYSKAVDEIDIFVLKTLMLKSPFHRAYPSMSGVTVEYSTECPSVFALMDTSDKFYTHFLEMHNTFNELVRMRGGIGDVEIYTASAVCGDDVLAKYQPRLETMTSAFVNDIPVDNIWNSDELDIELRLDVTFDEPSPELSDNSRLETRLAKSCVTNQLIYDGSTVVGEKVMIDATVNELNFLPEFIDSLSEDAHMYLNYKGDYTINNKHISVRGPEHKNPVPSDTSFTVSGITYFYPVFQAFRCNFNYVVVKVTISVLKTPESDNPLDQVSVSEMLLDILDPADNDVTEVSITDMNHSTYTAVVIANNYADMMTALNTIYQRIIMMRLLYKVKGDIIVRAVEVS